MSSTNLKNEKNFSEMKNQFEGYTSLQRLHSNNQSAFGNLSSTIGPVKNSPMMHKQEYLDADNIMKDHNQ